MAHYPRELVPNVTFLLPDTGLGERADDSLNRLMQKGFVASVGLTALHAARIFEIAQEPDVREYCPKDQTSRFHPDVVAGWIGKGSEGFEHGRGFVSIHDVPENNGARLTPADISSLTDNDVLTVAYGSSGWEKNKHLVGKDITVAFRNSEKGSALARERRSSGEKFGLGTPLCEIVLASAVNLYGAPAEKISLETWLSNVHARALYERIGFARDFNADVFEEKGRPTLHKIGDIINGYVVFENNDMNMVQDTRCNYYLLDHPLLES